MRKQELGVRLGWGVGRGSNLEDRDYIESPPKAPSLLIKRQKARNKGESSKFQVTQAVCGRQAGLAALYGSLGQTRVGLTPFL